MVCWWYLRGDYALYCMNNDANEIVLDYLDFIGECVLQALTDLGEEELTAAKRVVSLALVDGLNVRLLLGIIWYLEKLRYSLALPESTLYPCSCGYRNGCIKVMKTFKPFMVD